MRNNAAVLLGLLLVALSPVPARAEASDPEACLRDDLCRAQYTLARELSRGPGADTLCLPDRRRFRQETALRFVA